MLALILVLIFVSKVVLSVFRVLKVFVATIRSTGQENFPEAFGKWAVVTGSSNGIGMNYAKQLATRGMNLVLISNEDDKLHQVSKEIEERYGVETRVIVADFSLNEDEYIRIFKSLDDLDIGVLVNNVGTAGGLPNKFECMTRNQMWTMLMVNICAATSMTHHFLPKMKRNKRGLIVNISSITCLSPTPYGMLYGASKAYMKSFSDALREECKGSGVKVQTVCPGFVDTDIVPAATKADQLTPGLFFPKPDVFAKSAVASIGAATLSTGYWPHEIQYQLMNSLPVWLQIKIVSQFVDKEVK